jgi:hypothetical protein
MRASFSSPAASKTTYGTVLVSANHDTLRLHHHSKIPLVLHAHVMCFTAQLPGDISLYYSHQMSKVHWDGLCYAQKLLTKFKINDWLTGTHNVVLQPLLFVKKNVQKKSQLKTSSDHGILCGDVNTS